MEQPSKLQMFRMREALRNGEWNKKRLGNTILERPRSLALTNSSLFWPSDRWPFKTHATLTYFVKKCASINLSRYRRKKLEENLWK